MCYSNNSSKLSLTVHTMLTCVYVLGVLLTSLAVTHTGPAVISQRDITMQVFAKFTK